MNLSVAPVRLVFNVESINAVAVSSNWLYLTGGPSTVVRINLDSPSQIEDIQLPRKQVKTAGFIKYLFADSSGTSLLAVTSKQEHFFYSGNKQQFKHLGKLRGHSTICACFYNRHSFLIGTKNGAIVEVSIDSSANETYFKRDLRLAAQVWKSPNHEPVTSILFTGRDEVVVSCGSDVLKWSGSTAGVVPHASLGDPAFQRMFSAEPLTLLFNTENLPTHLVLSPDKKTLAAQLGHSKLAYIRSRKGSSSFDSPRHRITAESWREIDVSDGGDASIQHLLVSNYYLLAVLAHTSNTALHYSVLSINIFSPELRQEEPVSDLAPASIGGVAADSKFGTFWLFGHEDLLELKLNNEQAGMWKILANQQRFEEALDITTDHNSKSFILEKYGQHLISSDPARGAELLGLSDCPLEIAALDVMNASNGTQKFVSHLLKARLTHTKSRAQQIMLTSWMALVGEYSFLDHEESKWDAATIKQILKEQGKFDTYLAVLIQTGDVDAAISHYASVEKWSEALDLLRQHENTESVYKFATLMLNKAPRPTVESWMRMTGLDVQRLLPSLVSYSSEYRGPVNENQALRYLRHLISPTNRRKSRDDSGQEHDAASSSIGAMDQQLPAAVNVAVFNTVVTILCMQKADEELLTFLELYASHFNDHVFALRMCLKYEQFRSAVYLYTQAGLYEDAVQTCLDIGGPEMFELASDIASNKTTAASQGNEELRKYLLRRIARQAIKTQGPQAAIQFIKLLRVDDLLAQFPDFDTLSNLAPEIVKSLEQTNSRLNTLNQEIDETLQASDEMQNEISHFNRRSVLVEPGEPCHICHFPLVTRKFVVFPCQHGFHVDCVQTRLDASKLRRNVTDECVLCSRDNIQQIEVPLDADF